MSVIDGPNLSSSENLIFYLDAANFKSYPGSGATWYDLSSNRNNFTLFNTPTYTQNGTTGTYLTFNGTNQYARSTNAINFSAYSAVTLEIGYRTTVTNATQILYETTGTGGSTATGGITLLMNANNTSTAANTYLSQWQGYGPRLFGFTPTTTTSFNSILETFVNGSDSTGRQTLINGTTAQFFTNTAVTVLTSATTSGLSFANTWSYVASRAGTGNFFRGDIAYIRAWGKKLGTSDLDNNLSATAARQSNSYLTPTILTGDPTVIPPALYAFTDATFTSGTVQGRLGPSLAQARTGLTGTGVDAWKNNTAYFNTSNGIQLWTVPQTAIYSIEAAGAGAFTYRQGGYGARVRGTFALTGGEVIQILVGQVPTAGGEGGQGGAAGGTFVTKSPHNTNGSILVIAGGGGGGHNNGLQTNSNGNASGTAGRPGTSTGGTAGSSGNGGGGQDAGGGGGFFTNGTAGGGGRGGFAYVNGGFGSDEGGTQDGGFGGGGSSGNSHGAGGGGYSGGAGTGSSPHHGGGGGSYSNGIVTDNLLDQHRPGPGYVTITKVV